MYQLNKQSNSAKFFKWIWNKDVTDYKTMCPYFWTYVVTIMILPAILLFKLIVFIIPGKNKVEKTVDYISDSKVGISTAKIFDKIKYSETFWDKVVNVLKWTYFIIVGIVVLAMLFMLGHTFYFHPVECLAVIGGLTLLILAVFGLFALFSEYDLGRKIAYPFRLFADMVHSLYIKACPLIKWE